VRLRAAMLTGRRRPGVRGAGAPVKRRSDGYEFAELRGYVEGDDPRRIDWAATARAGALQTRVVFEDHALVIAAALDASRSMFVGRARTNYELACEAAADWYAVALDDDRCARIGSDGPLVLRTLRGRAAARHCAEVRDRPGEAFERSLRFALAALPRDAQLLLVSDFYELDEFEPLLRACAGRFETTALIASDPWREGLPLGGFVRLRDAESGRAARAYVGRRERERFTEAVVAREQRVLETLLRCGVRAAQFDERKGVAQALFEAFGLA
jgi:uncharacterized protein (DUF58 family)